MNTSHPIIIAIDGYSSSGKSTMAKALAKTIGYRYIDSGAMYRAVTLYAMQHGLISADGTPDSQAIIAALPDIDIDFKVDGDRQWTMLNGRNVETEIRSLAVSDNVSPVAAIPEVRHALVAMQQKMGQAGGIVMDGRDIGTTVFPAAEMKIFCNASAEKRAQRRYDELKARGDDVNFDDVLANVINRDYIDEHREESPLRRADDAFDLDNSELTPDEQNKILLDIFNKITSVK
ncbi:MAG: (d)CMP kinase [Lachnoclostridium sp.]|nr:(d)CMP kinase [Lachnoclostridium sp.]